MAISSAQDFAKDIEKAVSLGEKATEDPDAAQQVTGLIKVLQSYKVTTDLLVSTQAGKKLRKLTKHSNAAVAQAAAAAVAAWKMAVTQEAGIAHNGSAAEVLNGGAQGSQLSSQPSQASDAEQPPAKRQKSTPSAGLLASTASADKDSLPASSAPAPIQETGDSTRDRARQLFSDGLQMALPDVPNGDVAFACSEVECAIYAAAGGVNKDYKAKSRRLSFNIKDPRNPDLRRRVLKGEITAVDLVNMTPEELASDVRKSENAQIRKEALKESERGQHLKKATTDQFQCGKCRQRKTQYYQMQTRSADEPMTTFVTCVNCGNRWKFC
ncbi:hypothetical protein CVIRNUC_008996 [Coccomyxa viridis]|uniref:Transcription elongation factor n=1 Tax=Coccomyxa viridis TaxID=1274662 RepID=A0AAV1IH55_9CHLO|nr:hypothetical protein CVIRNUC_008996 [Coccomyxa viridis]